MRDKVLTMLCLLILVAAVYGVCLALKLPS